MDRALPTARGGQEPVVRTESLYLVVANPLRMLNYRPTLLRPLLAIRRDEIRVTADASSPFRSCAWLSELYADGP